MEWLSNAISLLCKGGPVMVPLMICSVFSVAVLIERYLKISRAQRDVSDVVTRAEDWIYNSKIDKALGLLEKEDSPVTRVPGSRCPELRTRRTLN